MWSALLMIIKQISDKGKLKKLEKKNNNPKEAKRLKKKVKRNDKIIIAVIISVVACVVVLAMMIGNAFLGIVGLAGQRVALEGDDEGVNAEEDIPNWQWETLDPSNPGYVDPSMGEFVTGGVYPKDTKLKQLAILLEIINNSCNMVNQSNGNNMVTPSSVITTLIRETGGLIFNKAIYDTSINIYGQLMYENPICNKGSSCAWIRGGTSHFLNSSVSGTKDLGDPHTDIPNTSLNLYNAYGGDHALGYGQMEAPYLDSKLVLVYPVGEYAKREYTSADRYKLDSELQFIRPNIAYTPDVIYNIANHMGYSMSNGSKTVWNEMEKESWFNSLSTVEKAFAYGSFKQVTYVGGGGVGEESMRLTKYLIKLCWALKADGHITSIKDVVKFAEGKYPSIVGNRLSNLYKNNKITHGGTAYFTDIFNAIINDTTLGSNTKTVSSELKAALSAASNGATKFEYYTKANGYKWRQLPPGAVGLESASHYIYQLMVAEINSAEKEVTNVTPGNGIVPGVGSNTNFVDYLGSGHFYNPTGSEYYAGDLKSIWFSQSGSYAGGKTVFGHKVPTYTTTIQNKPYMGRNYNAYGCPAYSMAMLLSNMLGTVVMPDQLPGTTTAGPGWKTGTHSVNHSGLGFVSGQTVINSVNKTLNENGAGYQLKYKVLTKSQMESYGTAIYNWMDHGAMMWVRVVNVNCAANRCKSSSHTKNSNGGCEYTTKGNHFVTISGYDKSKKQGDWYDLRILNSIVSSSTYTLCNANSGQLATAKNLQNGLAYHLRNYTTYCCMVVWRSDIAETLPGLS